MRKLPLVLTFFISSFFSIAQDYVPFIEDSVYWTWKENESPLPINNYYAFFGFNDTIIDGKEYRLVRETHYKKETSCCSSGFEISPDSILYYSELSFAFRNDSVNKKVYGINFGNRWFYPKEWGDEFLWYDFNLNLGDTLNKKSTYFDHNDEWFDDIDFIVDSIDTVEVCGKERRRFWTCMSHPENTITEGIGNGGLGTLFENPCVFMFETDKPYNIQMFTKGCDNFNEELSILTGTKEVNQKIEVNIFPNPSSDYLNIELDNLKTVLITDLKGRIVLTQNGESNNINTQSLSPGTYLLKAETQNNQFGWITFIKK